MGDLISRQAAIDAIQKEWYGCVNFDGSGIEIADDTNRIIENLPPVTPAENPNKWIPVSERLPSDCNEDWVLAQIQEDNGYLWIPCVAEYRKRKDDWFSDANDIGWLRNHDGSFKVIAWMPLPDPYKAESEE